MKELTLYYSPSCPYCHRVTDFMEKEKMKMSMKDVHEEGNRDELIKVGGKGQVPCLVIDGKPLYESLDIIEWLKKNYTK